MVILVTAGVTLVALLFLFFSARRDITLCAIEIESGNLVVVSGGLAPSVLSDMRDVVRRERIKHGTLRVMRVKDHARIEASSGVSHKQLQMLRNVVGQVPLAKLLAGSKPAPKKPRKKKRA